MFVYRAERYGLQSEKGEKVAEIIIGKQRNGPTGTVDLTFISEYASFENLADRARMAQPF
jgi:replicative DNA helicase